MTPAVVRVRARLAAAGLVINTFALVADLCIGRWRMAVLLVLCALINVAVLRRGTRLSGGSDDR